MSTVLKPLHVAKNLEELNKKVPNEKVKTSTPKVLCRLAEKLLLKARDEVLTGDEEQAYVLYMRFVDVFQSIRNSKTYRTEKKELDKLLSPSKASKALDEAERLSKSLKERYATLSSPSEKKPKLDNSSEHSNSADDQVVPSSPKGPFYNGAGGSQPLLSLGDSSLVDSKQNRLTPRELYSHLTSSPGEVLVLDCRPRSSYIASHSDSKKFPQWISVPEETVRNGITDQSVSSFLSPSGRKLWKERAKKKWLVLVDELEASESSSPIMALKDALIKWSTTTALPHEPFILEGGYAMWHLTYAVTCVGVYKRRPSSDVPAKSTKQEGLSSDGSAPSLDYPQFPTLNELTDSDLDQTNQKLSEESTYVQQQPNPNTLSSSSSSSLATTSGDSNIVELQGINTFTNHAPLHHHQPHSHMTQGAPFSTVAMEGGTFVPTVISYPPPVMPSYAPLPPPSTTIPVALTLEGESELLTPSLSDDLPHTILSHTEEDTVSQIGAEHVGMTIYTQPYPNQTPGLAQSGINNPPSMVPDASSFHTPISANFIQQQPPQPHQPPQPLQPPQVHQPLQPPQVHQPLQPPQAHQPLQPPQAHHPPQPHQAHHPPQPHQAHHPPQSHQAHQPPQPHQARQHPHPIQPQQFIQSIAQPELQSNGPPPVVPSSQAQPEPMWRDQQPRTHAPPGEGQVAWYGVPSQIAPPSQPGMSQPYPSQQANVPPTSQQPSDVQVHYGNSGVGSSPIPPTYELAKQLPSVQPPVPQAYPPQQVVPHQQTQFAQPQYQQPQAMYPPQVGYQAVGINPDIAERDAKIAELMELLKHKEKATQSKETEDEQIKKKQNEEKKELKELKESLEAERSQLEQAKQKQQEEKERDLKNLRQKIDEERAQMFMALEQERQKLEATRAQHLQEIQQRESNFKQVKEQYEREIAERQRQSTAMQQLEERRKQEHMFSLSQGMPPGWEKRLDSTTGRFYYVDHNSKTTHWNPPSSWLDYQAELQRQQQEKNRLAQLNQQQEALNARLRAQQQYGKGVAPHGTTPSGAPHSVGSGGTPILPVATKPSTPALPSPSVPTEPTPPTGLTGPAGVKSLPSVNRSTKPSSVQPPPSAAPGKDRMPVVPDRSTKPMATKRMTMTPALMKQKTDSLQPAYGSGCYALTGLRNLGNTCYMNSTLQCLSCTTPVIHHFTTSKYEEDINLVNPLGKQGVVAMEFAWLVKAMWGGQYKSVSPRDFKGMIDKFVPQMRGNNQQDSQEFLAFLMDGLHEDLNKVKKRQYITDVDNSKLSDGEAAKLAWVNHRKQNNSIIVDFFQGLFRSTVVCNSCKQRSVNFEPFMFLTLPIPPGSQAYKLEDCIRLFSSQERVSRSCSSCNHTVAFKRMEIWKLPPILLINIKRFTFEGQWREKRQNYIDYPVREPLNMSQFVVGEQPKSYQLYAVSNHFGSLAGGHYTACCKNPYKKTFYNFDDHEVREAQGRQIKSSAAYILFYTSLDLTPPKMF